MGEGEERKSSAKTSKVTPVGQEGTSKKLQPISIFRMWSYTTWKERLILLVGVLACVGAGFTIPYLESFLGEIADGLIKISKYSECFKMSASGANSDQDQQKQFDQVSEFAYYILVFTAGHFLFSFTYVTAFNYVAGQQACRLKSLYLMALFRQDSEWSDTHLANQEENFVSNYLEDISKIQDATGEKIGVLLYIIFTSIVSGIISLHNAWYLSVIIGSVAPVMLAVAFFIYWMDGRIASEEEASFAQANSISKEALVNIKAVYAYNGQRKEVKTYLRRMKKNLHLVRKRIYVEAIGTGFLWFINFAAFALAFWLGPSLVLENDQLCTSYRNGTEPDYTVGDFTGTFKIVNGIFELCQYFAYIDILSDGRTAAALIFSVCERVPVIDPFSATGLKPAEPLTGLIQFKSVSFYYPSRPKNIALRHVAFVINPGVYCVVGPSGSGKSTLMQLIMRFYDPTGGQILFDGVDAKKYNLPWLRSQIGVVSQDPVIFNTTVIENIRYGKPDATDEEIVVACDVACAHEFIVRLPERYQTVIGPGGIELSVYQKQRIAIARAVIRKPPILIFDEATRALETKNQSRWHRRLINSRKGLTTIIVAHLFPTLNLADYIISLKNGKLDEMGTNHELISSGKSYSRLYERLIDQEEVEVQKRMSAAAFKKRSVAPLTISASSDMTVRSFKSIHDDPRLRNSQILRDSLVAGHYEDVMGLGLTTMSSPFWRLIKLAAPNWHLLLSGLLMAVFLGMTCPTYAVLFGAVMNAIGEKSDKEALQDVREYALTVFILGFTASFTTASTNYCFTWASNNIVIRLRKRLLATLLSQEVALYDNPQMNPKTLFSRISSEIATLSLSMGNRLSLVVQAFSTLGLTTVIAYRINPTLGYIILPIAPFISIVATISVIFTQRQVKKEKVAADKVSHLVFEAYYQLKTVAILGREKAVVSEFVSVLEEPQKNAKYLSLLQGLLHGLSQSSLYFAYAGVTYFGTELMRKKEIKFSDIFLLGEALTWCLLAVGQALAYTYNLGRAQVSAKRIFQILDRKSRLHSGDQTPTDNIAGDLIEFQDVDFAFPIRPALKLLDQCNLKIKPYEKVGIVGSVDCGKLAIIPLLLRLYDVKAGSIKVGGVDIREWNLKALRAQMSIMFSEPLLFNRSIAENIAYGDNARTVLVPQVVQAAKMAKIHNFIMSLEEGYQTVIGPGGYLLSRGQQNAIAFARAILRKPRLLLLEEAARDYDSESTRLIEEYVYESSKDFTVICATTELRAIRRYDRIVVLHVGQEGESGTHDDLVNTKGIYRKLWKLQNIGFHLE